MGGYVIFDFNAKKCYQKEEISFFKGFVQLPKSSEPKVQEKLISCFKGKTIKLKVSCSNDFENKRIIRNITINGKGKNGVTAELSLLQHLENDSMVIATSWKNDRKCFYFNQKVNCMQTTGSFTFQDKKYSFEKHGKQNFDYSVLDWGRGPHKKRACRPPPD